MSDYFSITIVYPFLHVCDNIFSYIIIPSVIIVLEFNNKPCVLKRKKYV